MEEKENGSAPISFGSILLLAVVGRLAFNTLQIPSVEPVIPLAVLAGMLHKGTNGFLAGAGGYFFSNLLQLSLGPWTFFQALAGGIAGYLGTGTTKESYMITVLIGTLIFEIIINLWGAGFVVSTDYFFGSLPFTITHFASNIVFAYVISILWLKEEKS